MRILCCLIILFWIIKSEAQILNFEKFRPNVDTSNIWKSSLSAGFDLKQKATRSLDLKSQMGTYYISEKHSYFLLGDIGLTRVDKENIFQQGYLHYRTVLNRRQKIAYEPFIQFQYDLGKGLKRRHLFGSNVRINFYNDSTLTLSMGTGAFYENENWIDTDNNTYLNINIKSNNYVSLNWIVSDWAVFFLTSYYQAPFDDFLSPRLILESNLQLKFTENFAYDVRFETNIDRTPVVEAGRLTYLLSSGFRYSF